MRPEIEKKIDKVKKILDQTNGVLSKEATQLLDEAWEEITSDPRNREVLSLPITDVPDCGSFAELAKAQAAIDREIMEMLNLKEDELESLASGRPLTEDEIKLKARIATLRNEIEA